MPRDHASSAAALYRRARIRSLAARREGLSCYVRDGDKDRCVYYMREGSCEKCENDT